MAIKRFNHSAHRRMWLWLAENPEALKREWPGFKRFKNTPDCLCFACEAAGHGEAATNLVCEQCPLMWPDGFPSEDRPWCHQSLYSAWNCVSNSVDKTKLALQIANLPIRRRKGGNREY
jgi:hypothetical protein